MDLDHPVLVTMNHFVSVGLYSLIMDPPLLSDKEGRIEFGWKEELFCLISSFQTCAVGGWGG